jgi:hypothetical protein
MANANQIPHIARSVATKETREKVRNQVLAILRDEENYTDWPEAWTALRRAAKRVREL